MRSKDSNAEKLIPAIRGSALAGEGGWAQNQHLGFTYTKTLLVLLKNDARSEMVGLKNSQTHRQVATICQGLDTWKGKIKMSAWSMPRVCPLRFRVSKSQYPHSLGTSMLIIGIKVGS